MCQACVRIVSGWCYDCARIMKKLKRGLLSRTMDTLNQCVQTNKQTTKYRAFQISWTYCWIGEIWSLEIIEFSSDGMDPTSLKLEDKILITCWCMSTTLSNQTIGKPLWTIPVLLARHRMWETKILMYGKASGESTGVPLVRATNTSGAYQL